MAPQSLFLKQKKYWWHDDTAAAIILGGAVSFLGVTLFATLFLGQGTINSASELELDAGISTLITSLLSLIAFGGSVWLLGVRKHPLKWHAVGLRKTSPRWLLASILLGTFFVPLNWGISLFVERLTRDGVRVGVFIPSQQFEVVPIGEFLLVFIGVAVIVPIAEELFFRGVLFKWMRTRTNLGLALLVTSMAFGAVHFSAVSLISLSVAGALCAVMYEYSGCLWNAIAVHAANNGTLVILTYFVFKSPLI